MAAVVTEAVVRVAAGSTVGSTVEGTAAAGGEEVWGRGTASAANKQCEG